MADIGQRFGVVGIEVERALRFRFEHVVLAAEEMHDRQPAPGIGALRIEPGRGLRYRKRPPDRIGARVGVETVFGEISRSRASACISALSIEV